MNVYAYSDGRPPGVHMDMIPCKLLDWIDVTKLNWSALSKNKNAKNLLEHPLHSSHTNKINWDSLSENTAPWATYLLEQHPLHSGKINWYVLSGNPSTHAIRMLRQEINRVNNRTYAEKLVESWVEMHMKWMDFFMGTYNYEKHVYTKIDWYHLSANPGAMELLEEEYTRNPQNHRIDDSGLTQNPKMNAWAMNLLEETYTKKPLMWDWLSGNPSPFAKQLLEKYPEKINWHELSKNSSPWAIQLLEQQPNKIDWYNLSRNTSPFAIRLLEETYKKNPQKISWYSLSENTQAIHILEQSILEQKYGNGNDTIGWIALSSNPKAIHILEQHPDKIHYTVFSRNPAIFTYDYHQMKIDKHELHEDLIRTVFHPDNIQCFLGWGFYTDE